ncbi:hypothetical protein [Deinococcus enclensis]|uniref:Uncharacterized protein n=1 Tax=Deinococcus enclensis TaxID=1049582 RepID=A0ABT9MHR7_9DEIO|nr:hypothetical protein [Deinococcus enclensis]MDP9766133.1 hypothetical protein [Deinococcus enclensis]
MKRLALLAFLALGAQALAEDAPDYSGRDAIYSQTVLTPLPNARFMSITAKNEYKKCLADNKGSSTPRTCTNYEFTAPLSSLDESVRVATDLREAWQRFEDRYYQRANLELNNPSSWFSSCLLNFSTGSKAQKAVWTLNSEPWMYPKEIKGLPTVLPDDRLRLDSYGLFPKVRNGDYCDGVSPRLDFMYLAGTCNYLGAVRLFCIEGTQNTLNPAAPRPLWFRYDLALQRIQGAIEHAHKVYLPEYVADVTKALAPTVKWWPLMWTGLDDAVVAPVMTLKPDMNGVLDEARKAGNALGSPFQATAQPYYLQGLSGPPAQLLRVHQLPGGKDDLDVNNPPGVWKLEEFKRRFPPNAAPLYERFGYVHLFQAWNEMVTTLLPETVSAKAARQMIYQATGIYYYVHDSTAIPVPAPILISEYAAGLPYAGPKTHFTWVSLPEGYPVPRVQGRPVLDYGSVTK